MEKPEQTSRRPLVAIVDDNAPVARAVERSLAPQYETRVFNSGAAVLDWLADGGSPDVILCDLWMPGVTGEGVHQTLRCVHPDLLERIIYMSGGLNIHAATAFLAQVPNPCLAKPVVPAMIRSAVEAVLNRVGARAG